MADLRKQKKQSKKNPANGAGRSINCAHLPLGEMRIFLTSILSEERLARFLSRRERSNAGTPRRLFLATQAIAFALRESSP